MSDTGVHNLGRYGSHIFKNESLSLTDCDFSFSKPEYEKALTDAGDALVVLDCFATWCGPCKVIAPQVVKMAEEFENARFYKIDVDEVNDVALELNIRAMPTFLLFKKGEKIEEIVGANEKALREAIKKNI
jgi:thioredoxin 1